MHIETKTGVTKISDKFIEKSISHILFKKDGAVGAELMHIKKTSKSGGGDVTLIPTVKIIDLLEIAAMGEGTFINTDALCYGLIILGIEGAVKLQEGEQIVMNVTAMTEAKNYTFMGIEYPENAKWNQKIDIINIAAGTASKKQEVGKASSLVVPKTIESIEVTYLNGNNVKYTYDELLAINGAANDIVSIDQTGAVYGSKNLLSYNLVNARSFEVFTNGNGLNYYLLSAVEG